MYTFLRQEESEADPEKNKDHTTCFGIAFFVLTFFGAFSCMGQAFG